MASRVLSSLGQAVLFLAAHAYRVVAIASSEDSADFAAWPTITSGSGAPTEAQPNGSTYYRTNGTEYKRTGGAWVLQINGGPGGAAATGISAAAAGGTGSNTTGISAAAAGDTGDNGNANTSAELTGITGATALFNSIAAGDLGNGAILAKTVSGVHAGYGGDQADNTFPGPFTNPEIPRNLRVVFGIGWDGGDVIVGGNTLGSGFGFETFADPGAGGGTVVGVKCFIDVQSAVKTAIGINPATASIGTGDKIGVANMLAGVGFLSVDGVMEAVTLDQVEQGYTPTSTPDAGKVFAIYHARTQFATVNVTDGGHTHIVGGHTHTSSAINVTDPTHVHP